MAIIFKRSNPLPTTGAIYVTNPRRRSNGSAAVSGSKAIKITQFSKSRQASLRKIAKSGIQSEFIKVARQPKTNRPTIAQAKELYKSLKPKSKTSSGSNPMATTKAKKGGRKLKYTKFVGKMRKCGLTMPQISKAWAKYKETGIAPTIAQTSRSAKAKAKRSAARAASSKTSAFVKAGIQLKKLGVAKLSAKKYATLELRQKALKELRAEGKKSNPSRRRRKNPYTPVSRGKAGLSHKQFMAKMMHCGVSMSNASKAWQKYKASGVKPSIITKKQVAAYAKKHKSAKQSAAPKAAGRSSSQKTKLGTQIQKLRASMGMRKVELSTKSWATVEARQKEVTRLQALAKGGSTSTSTSTSKPKSKRKSRRKTSGAEDLRQLRTMAARQAKKHGRKGGWDIARSFHNEAKRRDSAPDADLEGLLFMRDGRILNPRKSRRRNPRRRKNAGLSGQIQSDIQITKPLASSLNLIDIAQDTLSRVPIIGMASPYVRPLGIGAVAGAVSFITMKYLGPELQKVEAIRNLQHFGYSIGGAAVMAALQVIHRTTGLLDADAVNQIGAAALILGAGVDMVDYLRTRSQMMAAAPANANANAANVAGIAMSGVSYGDGGQYVVAPVRPTRSLINKAPAQHSNYSAIVAPLSGTAGNAGAAQGYGALMTIGGGY